MRLSVLFCVVSSVLAPVFSTAARPQLYAQAGYQSPVRGEADDLQLLAGYGLAADDVVVYNAIIDASQIRPPSSVPEESTSSEGVAQIVSAAGAPHSLTVVLPRTLVKQQPYALWVRGSNGEWSNDIRINDPRPLWFTPAYIYTNGSLASLPREIKVVGRNLRALPGSSMQVRLSGPQRLGLQAIPPAESGAIDDYTIRAVLPESLTPGSYKVEVSGDGSYWLPVAGSLLEVRTAPVSRDRVATTIPAHGGCQPDDLTDDAPCIAAAIAAAARAGGGTVSFGSGVWNLDRVPPGIDPREGLVVPAGVNLVGEGNSQTTVLRGAQWQHRDGMAAFTLRGQNRVEGFTFADARAYQPADPFSPMLRLGGATRHRVVENVVITRNRFDKPHVAIQDSGAPIRYLFITYNEFGAYREAIRLDGNRYALDTAFRVDDAVVSHNVFKPGSYIDVAIAQGAIATEIGASSRLDFSHNLADGSSAQYLYSPEDARGWRAAHFWHLNNNHELMLVAQNTATCTGDKAGDGEAFAYDNNGNTFAFDSSRTVLAASADSVTAAGPLVAQQSGQRVQRPDFYVGHWLQVVGGPGLGQVRKIVAYRADESRVTFEVAPAWDVVPQVQLSSITIGREFWQVYTIDNRIDNRQPLCRKSNRNRPKAGAITLWAQTADSVVEGNQLFDSDGISLQNSYVATGPGCTRCDASTNLQSFVEIHGNTLDGEYSWLSDCSQSGIMIANSAAPAPSGPPPTLGYGISVAHNTIRHADGLRGGAITVPLTWHQGPPPHRWNAIETLLIHHNVIRDLNGPAPMRRCDHAQRYRIGINLYEAQMVRGTVLYANTCTSTGKRLQDGARETIRVCPSSSKDSCECTD